MRILAIETSFDETAAAVVEDGTNIISNVLASSKAMHDKYGGVVPEVAAREQLKCIIPVITEALSGLDLQKDIDQIAVTVGPGLIGSLLVGVETAKTIAYVTGKPIVPVNHVIAHIYANFVNSPHPPLNVRGGEGELFPAVSLVASGAHTELYLMKSIKGLRWLGGTLDDAAGECFDKCARLIGFGHGGGLAIQKAATKGGDITLPRPLRDESYNFSFSGLKTAVMREWKKRNDTSLASVFAHEIQEAITDVLVEKTLRAAKQYSAKSVLLSGGVASNTRLREKFSSTIHVPEARLCTDNAVMIGACAYFNGSPADWPTLTAQPDLSVEL